MYHTPQNDFFFHFEIAGHFEGKFWKIVIKQYVLIHQMWSCYAWYKVYIKEKKRVWKRIFSSFTSWNWLSFLITHFWRIIKIQVSQLFFSKLFQILQSINCGHVIQGTRSAQEQKKEFEKESFIPTPAGAGWWSLTKCRKYGAKSLISILLLSKVTLALDVNKNTN